MYQIAILSDIHSNLEALLAVLDEIDSLGVKDIYSLGDTVGYGPDPVKCVQLAWKRFKVRVVGNHERGLVQSDGLVFNRIAKKSLDWTRERLKTAKLLRIAAELDDYKREGEYLFLHGSVKGPVTDYVTEVDSAGFSTFDQVISTLANDFTGFRVCFVGHNHQPFLATNEGFIHPHDDVTEFSLEHEKLYVSVGSVGQPRDGDPRACFVTMKDNVIKYHRVRYDVERTANKIIASGLPPELAARLSIGK